MAGIEHTEPSRTHRSPAGPASGDSLFDEPAMSFASFLGVFWVRRVWVLVAMSLVWIAWVGWTISIVPTFRATAIVAPSAPDKGLGSAGSLLGSLGGLASIAGLNLSSQSASTEEALAILRSRSFAAEFIERHGIREKILDGWPKSPLGRLRSRLFSDQPNLDDAVRLFRAEVLGVSTDKKTGLVSIAIVWIDRVEAARWANLVVAGINQEMRDRAIGRTNDSIRFLEQERDRTQLIETREAINRLIEAQVSQKMVATVSRDYAFRVVDSALVPTRADRAGPRKLTLLLISPIVALIAGVVVGLGHIVLGSVWKTFSQVRDGRVI